MQLPFEIDWVSEVQLTNCRIRACFFPPGTPFANFMFPRAALPLLYSTVNISTCFLAYVSDMTVK